MSLEGDFDDVEGSFFALASSSFSDLSSAVSDDSILLVHSRTVTNLFGLRTTHL